VVTLVADIIQVPPVTEMYDTIKKRLIDIYTYCKKKKLRKLLSAVELGDRKPSVLLNEMQRLRGITLSADLLKLLWLQHLPITTQSCLAVTKGSLDELARLADPVAEIRQPRSLAAVLSDHTTELLQTLLKKVTELKNKSSYVATGPSN